jgi:hypothetical protein
MIGDSFLRGIRDNVELSTSDNFGIYSSLHPGCDLDKILQVAYKASKNLTHKDLIYVCGGTNDFNSGTEGPNVNNTVEFTQSNKHTNVIFTNVPLRYDLSYHSQINEKIRAYNSKIREIIQEHERVTLMEMDTARKDDTRYGLRFNKIGKWRVSHKITKLIYSILGVKIGKNRTTEGEQESQDNKNKFEERDSIQGCPNNKQKKEDARIVTHNEVVKKKK